MRLSTYSSAGELFDTQSVVVAPLVWQVLPFGSPLHKPVNGINAFDVDADVVKWAYNPDAWGGGVRTRPPYPSGFDPNDGDVYGHIALQLHLLENKQVMTAETFAAVEESVADISSLTTRRPYYVGRQQTPQNTGTTNGGATLTFRTPIPANADGVELQLWGGASNGTVKISRRVETVQEDGDREFERIGAALTVNVAAGVLNTIDISALKPRGGEYISLFSSSDAITLTNTTEDSDGFYYAGGDGDTFTIAAGDTGGASRIEARLTFSMIAGKQEVLRDNDFAAPHGFDRVARNYRIGGQVRARIGFQNVDGQDPGAGFFEVRAVQHNSRYQFTTYQYGFALNGFGEAGDLLELQLCRDTEPLRPPILSVRRREGAAIPGPYKDGGALIMARDSGDHSGIWLSYQRYEEPHIAIEKNNGVNKTTPTTMGYWHPETYGRHEFWVGRAVDTAFGTMISNGTRVAYFEDEKAMIAGVEVTKAQVEALLALLS